MRILAVGDIHGQFGVFNTLINKKQPEVVIQLGDNAKILDKDGKIISEEKFRKIIWKRSIKEKLENISKKQD